MSKNLFSIGEIAKTVGVTRKIILNYEAKGLIKPDKKEGITGNRYYTIDTFTQIRTIRIFQNLGLSLNEIKEYFNDTTDLAPIIDRLEIMRDELNLAIEKLKERNRSSDFEIKEITIEPQTIYCRTYDSSSIEEKTKILRETALEAMLKHGTDTTRRMYFTEYFDSSPEKVSYCVAVPSNSSGDYIKKLPSLRAISVFHHGAYEDVYKTRKMIVDFANQNKITLSGVFRNLYLEGPPQHKDKSKYITQIIALIKE